MSEITFKDASPESSAPRSADRRGRLLLLIGVCCVGFFITNVATPGCFDKPLPAFLALGIVTAQLTVICVWGTLVRGAFWVRLPWTFLLLILAWCGFAWGIEIESGFPDIDSMLGVGLVWIIGFLTSFVPLKIAAICFRWQIVQETEVDRVAGQDARYAIRDIMIGTLFLALSMGIVRLMLPDDDISFDRALKASVLNDAESWVAILIYGIISLLVKLPCIWISLGEESGKIRLRIVQWIFYCFALAIVEYVLLIAVLGDPGRETAEVLTGVILGHQIMGFTMLGVFLTLRGLGYRLRRNLSVQRQPEAGDKYSKAAMRD